jgi:hypothetical protein
MAAATQIQLENLETAHKQHLISLIQGADFRLGIAEKYGKDSLQFLKWNTIFNTSMIKWLNRNIKLESQAKRRMLPDWIYSEEGGNWVKLFNTREGVKKLVVLAKQLDKEGKGIGFIPLIIWAVLGIVGLFTAESVVDELNNTAAEQKELIDASTKFCADNNLTPEQCKELLSEQTQAVKDEGGGIMDIFGKLLLFGGLAYVTVQFVIPAFSDKKKQSA